MIMDLKTCIGKETFVRFRNNFHQAFGKHQYDIHVLKHCYCKEIWSLKYYKGSQESKGKWRKAENIVFLLIILDLETCT